MSTVGIRFLYQFSVGMYDAVNPGDNVISVTSTLPGDHDKKNLTTSPLRETWRSNGIGTQEIVIRANDLTDSINVFALLNHNLTDDATVIVYASPTNDFTAPALTVPMTWNKKHMVIVQDFGTAYEYFKIKIVDPTNPCGYIEIGRIVGGLALTLTQDEDITDDYSVSPDDLAYKMQTEGFFRASNERVKVDKLGMRFDKLYTRAPNNVNYLGLLALAGTVGETLPFLTIIDPEDPYFGLYWAQFDTMPARNFTTNRYVSLSFSLQEVY